MKCIPLLLLAALFLPTIALAEGECSAECPTGQVNVGFADGQGSNCVCMDQGQAMNNDAPYVSEGGEEG